MDNASTHMDKEIRTMIRDAGAILLYTAPYSPDLNPIEALFHLYKAYLKRHESEFIEDPIGTHWKAVNEVSRDNTIKNFRHCHVPHSHKVKTSIENGRSINSVIKRCKRLNQLYSLYKLQTKP